VTAEQTARKPRSNVVGPPIVAEVVLVDVPMKELQRNLMMDAEDRPLKRSEISLGRVDVMAWTAPPLAVAGAITHDCAGNSKEVTCPILP
jgi:hypothetical protein